MKAEAFGLMAVAHNIYGGVMEEFPLPLRDFELANELFLDLVLNTSKDSPIGFILGFDSQYAD